MSRVRRIMHSHYVTIKHANRFIFCLMLDYFPEMFQCISVDFTHEHIVIHTYLILDRTTKKLRCVFARPFTLLHGRNVGVLPCQCWYQPCLTQFFQTAVFADPPVEECSTIGDAIVTAHPRGVASPKNAFTAGPVGDVVRHNPACIWTILDVSNNAAERLPCVIQPLL